MTDSRELQQLVAYVIGCCVGWQARERRVRREQLRALRADLYGETADSFFITCTVCDALYDRNVLVRCPNCAQPAPVV